MTHSATANNKYFTPIPISFLTIWIGQAISLLGSSLVRFAIIWHMTKTTGSATVLATATLVTFVPSILIGPIAGTLVDRWNRKRILMAADGMIAGVTAVLALLFAYESAQLWQIYALLLIRAIGTVFHNPAMQASTTLMVPEKQYARIAGFNSTLRSSTGILAPLLGALLVETISISTILTIDIVTACLAIGALFLVNIPQPKSTPQSKLNTKQPSILSELRSGLQFVRNWPGFMMLLIIIMFINLVFSPAATLTPLLVTDHFHGGALELAWIQSAISIGSLIGGMMLSIWGGTKRRIVPSMAALVLLGVSMAAVGFAPSALLSLAIGAMFCVGLTISFGAGLRVAIIQTVVPPQMQGRIFTLMGSTGSMMAPIGLFLAGPVADRWGVPVWYVLCGVITAVLGTITFFIPSIMHIEDKQ